MNGIIDAPPAEAAPAPAPEPAAEPEPAPAETIAAWDRAGYTPLHLACENGDAKTALNLLIAGASVNGPRGTPSPLALCIERGDAALATTLIKHGAAIDLGTADVRSSALALASAAAAADGPTEGANIDGGWALLHMLIGTPAAVAAMCYAPSGAAPLDQLMLAAAAHGFHPIVQLLLQRARSPAPAHPDSRSALYDAVAGGHAEAARLLLDAGADANAYAHGQPTGYEAPLAAASHLPTEAAARHLTWLLRAAGADVDGRDRDGRTVRERLERERPEAKALIADLGRALATPKLPPGWLEAKDEKNRTFYWSARTKETRWARPVAASAFA